MNSKRTSTHESIMVGVVLSATSYRFLLLLPDWSERFALMFDKRTNGWPPMDGNVHRPAVNIRYLCHVDVIDDSPHIRRIRGMKSEHGHPTPLLAPAGIHGPPDRLAIHDSEAMGMTLDMSMKKKLDAKDRESVLYIIRRAYGQGFLDGGNHERQP